ncbi:hypothetical protein AAVH_20725, partial [Aphelenchoides avenae]
MATVNPIELLHFFLQCGFIVFNLSVMVYIYRGRRSDPKLRSGFFVLFLAVTMADWVNSVTFVLINTLPNAFRFAEAFAATISCKWYMITGWCMIFQALVHTTIAFNRFSCFYFPDQLNWMWTGRRIAMLLALYVVISVVSVMHHYISPCIYLVIGGRIVGVPVVDATPQLVGMVLMAVIYAFSSVTSFILSTATIRRLLLIRKYGRLTNAVWREIRLFLHSLLLLALQAMYAGMFICRLPVLRNTPVGSFFFCVIGYGAGDAYTLLGPLFLIIL